MQPGSLIDIQFSLDPSNRDVAEEFTVLAKPGESFVFSGTVSSLDVRSGALAVDNHSDDQNYEIHFDPLTLSHVRDLKVGTEISASAIFHGRIYERARYASKAKKSEQKSEHEEKE